MKSNSARTLALLTNGLQLRPDHAGSLMTNCYPEEWEAVIRLANTHLTTAALAGTLREAGVLPRLPTEVRSYLQFILEQNTKRNLALRDQMHELLRDFAASGISPLVLKGALTLLDDGHCAPGTRMMADIDFAVPKAARRKAVETLAHAGYRIADKYPEGHHAVAEFMRPGEAGAFDLHLELIDQKYVLPASEVWSRSRRIQDSNGAAYHVPSATDRVLHTLLHAQIHHRGDFYCGRLRLGALYDFARMVDAFGGEVDWRFIVDRLQAFGLMTSLLSYLFAAEVLFGLQWPLADSPTRAARLHCRRCLAQLRFSVLDAVGLPWGNLRSAFASHRMHALYDDHKAGMLHKRSYHAWQYLQRYGATRSMKRLFRV